LLTSEADHAVLDKLLSRMKRHPDFPAFVSNISEISRKADANGSYSASQVGEAIVKDFALTAKLLRLVNTTYVNRFGGKVYSVQQAVVILGFDSVRSVALGISVYKKPGTPKRGARSKRSSGDDARVVESAINSLVSGEIARALAPRIELDDPEFAMMCAIFRNVGYHLVLHYLPEHFAKIEALTTQQGLSHSTASQRVLGMSCQKLGVVVGERWRLPKPLLDAMTKNPGAGGKLDHDSDRVAALAKLANDLADAVATGNPNSWNSAIDRLLARHKNLLSLEARDVLALLEATKKSFAERYAAAFGPFCKKSRFLRGADALTGAETSASEETSPQLDEVVAEQVEALRNASTTGEERGEALGRALEALREAFGVGRLVLLGPSRDRSQLSVVASAGNQTKALRGEFEVTLTPGKDAH
jgi:HD-like signal output (HDOD) protein